MSQSDTGNVGSPGSLAEDEQRSSAPAEQVEERPPAPEIDISKPHVARIYDYFLGGKNNYAADREMAEQVLKVFPEAPIGARINRRFLIETVRWLVQEAGIRQFLDIGSGLPTQQNVHEVAQAIDKDARVVYIDNDPLVRVHADVLLATNPNTIVLEGDLRDPQALLNRPELREHLDFSQPIALLLVAVLHFIEDTQQAYDIVKTLCDALPSGSYLAIVHTLKEETMDQASAIYRRASLSGHPRTEEEIRGFFAGLTPVGRGLVRMADWTPPDRPNGLTEGNNVVSLGNSDVLRKLPGMCGIARIDR
ncbi:hypothetical protein GCM10010106_06100 [Thermopolyspora flexuosa]|uniref:S-adenosyl methyltransferase n=1 Tax=Thermopolyspora flexuosa TaxID=103836 RepID=A0A543IZA4_9ACTN|nr:SAM-dependent methyltransferase [Thermopolyspora flexuosa]TQM75888.1 S-adenosyl methyltransferase [Thermopolyspora flexuosa]GGM62937.1 hypothetical protein GCM10010106_06100 [Thermopolyspora flexuosa]